MDMDLANIVLPGMITLIFLQSTVTIVIFGYPQQAEVLVVPVATLFAFTGLRGTMPGAPAGFGAIVGESLIMYSM